MACSTLPNRSTAMTGSTPFCRRRDLPVDASALRDVEVGNLDAPLGLGVLARDESGEGALTHAPFLADHCNDERHSSQP